MTHRFRSPKGMSLAEATITLTVMSVLTSAMTPVVGNYIAEAQVTRARSDVQTLAVAVARFAYDVGFQAERPGSWAELDLLVGAGDAPSGAAEASARWVEGAEAARVGRLDQHLVENQPAYRARSRGQAGSMVKGWAGPYVSPGVPADPWGNRYAVNIGQLRDGTGDAFVISAGPNGRIETPFSGAATTPQGDDIVAIIGGAGR